MTVTASAPAFAAGPPRPCIETDVLVIGSGPAGSSAALFLSRYGVRNVLVTRERWTSDTPRAHITNQRTMEILRDMGLEQRCAALATPQALMANNVWLASMAGEELARTYAWGNHPVRRADYELASPCSMCDLPQNELEPVLLGEAARLGTHVRLDTELVEFEQDDDGVTASVRDRLSGASYAIRAKYMIGADGGRSMVAKRLGLPLDGQYRLGMAINVTFHADLSRHVAHRPGVLFWIMQPGADHWAGGGTLRMVRPWTEWLAIFGHDPAAGEPNLDHPVLAERLRGLIGDDTIDVTVRSASKWMINNVVARRYSEDRVFCAGDAVHRHPPTNGLGSNTSIQDSYNLAWKLGFVLGGKAAPALLETYSVERQPVGRQVVDRAIRSFGEYGPVTEAFGVRLGQSAAERVGAIRGRLAPSREASEQRAAIRHAVAAKDYEYNCHGVELDQRYVSAAIIDDGAPAAPVARDPELFHHPTTRPGAHLPHAWIGRGAEVLSTLDLVGGGRFAVITGIGGEAWIAAANGATHELGVEVAAATVGPGQQYEDLYGDWRRLSGIDEDGCILIRPDGYIGWRCMTANPALGGAPHQALLGTLRAILGLRPAAVGPSDHFLEA